MKSVDFNGSNIVLKGDGDKVIDIRAHFDPRAQQPCFITVWEPTDKERIAIAQGLKVVLWTMGTAFPPTSIGVIDTDGSVVDRSAHE